MRYDFAAKLAVGACKSLAPFCETIHIAGSLRRVSGMNNRNNIDIKDIDLICVPRFTEVVQLGLFNPPFKDSEMGDSVKYAATREISINFTETIKSIGQITKGKTDGRYMSLNVKGYKVDVFMPDPVDFFRQYCIRTGSVEYVRWNIAGRWSKLGWCGTDHGLRRITDCLEIPSATGKNRWEIINQDGERPPAWESEEHFFEWLGIKWIHPRVRTI